MLRDDPYGEAGQDAVADLRSDYVPQAFADSGNSVYITGDPAMVLDFNTQLSDNLPYVFAFVLGLSFVLLMIAFRSIVVPAMSIVLNLLSVGAAYGSVVLVFQHGWLADTLGLTQVETITNWLPVMLFCILFGLSMDYHVFLLSRVREAWDHTADNQASIVSGLQSTGRIITGAALIMVAVFSAFAFGRMSEMQQMGFGLGVAVLLDATLIRTILVPATMRLHWRPQLVHAEGAALAAGDPCRRQAGADPAQSSGARGRQRGLGPTPPSEYRQEGAGQCDRLLPVFAILVSRKKSKTLIA